MYMQCFVVGEGLKRFEKRRNSVVFGITFYGELGQGISFVTFECPLVSGVVVGQVLV